MLKKKVTRIIAGILSCILVGVFVSRVSSIIISSNNNTYIENDIPTATFTEEMNDIYYKLWAIGNMYLRYLDSKGNFQGTEEFKEQTILELRGLDCMDENGNLLIDGIYNDYEYLVSYGVNSFSNTDKSYNELKSNYSMMRKNDNIEYMPRTHWWYTNSSFNAYSTNWGMHYYYLSGKGIALFDYDTDGFKSYIDELGATIYYKTDGSTPLPDEDVDYYDYRVRTYEEPEETVIYQEAIDEVAGYETENVPRETIPEYEDGLYRYDSEKGGFIKIEQDKFTTTLLPESLLTIAIKPSGKIITDFENYYRETEENNKNLVRSAMGYIPMIIIAFILMIFVIIMGGYNEKDKKYKMSFWEKIFAEIPIAVIVLAILGGIMLSDAEYLGIYQFITELYNEKTFALIYGIAYGSLFGIIMLMLNTLTIRIKCHGFWKTTLLWTILYVIYGWIKKFMKLLAEKTVNRDMLRNDIFTRKFIALILIFGIAEIFFAIILLGCGAVGLFIFFSLVFLAGYIILNLIDLKAMNRVSKHITAINSGDYTPHTEPKDSPAYCITEKLNNISAGIQTAVDRQVQSERMKIDLVTNVSHDLKTPLTSIISYIDLLSTEELSPEARDYVTIIDNKSQRLKSMVADLFDLAKATSHTDIDMEKIDVVILANQVLADLNDKIETSDKIIRMDIQAEIAPVMAEGKKMYRVFQNLIDNALKYSLDGTRIYLTLKNELGYCIINIKNISSYEMNFTADEIIERFTRGDESRSTEGNGLGLSIAKSFTEACGGTFRITIDGDVFMAEIKLPIIK
ncbi:MAG: GHKL domain-containing protein [Ruminococcus sp.]|nr:GHKL domain-containing protein [Ruminococcus sp.]